MNAPVRDVWGQAQELQQMLMEWLPTAKVELDRDPSANIGSLHQKAAEIRSQANRVRDAVYATMAVNMVLIQDANTAEWQYEQAMAASAKDPTNVEVLAKLKTKDEREAALQQINLPLYQRYVETKAHRDEWDQFLKMVNLVYYSLTHTREDLNTQVSIIKQQMFNGEIRPNKDLDKLGSVFDMLGDEAKALLRSVHTPDTAPVGNSEEVSWDS